jgi:V8-like Glu-specific endopeptidase
VRQDVPPLEVEELRPHEEQRTLIRRWLRLALGISASALLVGATPAYGEQPSSGRVEQAARARASYGFPAQASRVRAMMASTDNAATAQYGFPLTRREQAELVARSAYARRFQAATLPYVERLAGYGGVWVDHRQGGRMVVGLTRVRRAVTQQVRARLPRADRGVRFVRVDDSAAELDRALRRAERDWAALRTGLRPQAFGISHRHNRLVVKVLPSQLERARRAARRMARRAGVDVRVEASARVSDSACSSRNRCFGPLRLGTRINHGAVYRTRAPRRQWNCAIGFMLSDRTFLTAGHCAHRRKGPWHGHAAYRKRYGRVGERVASRYTSERRDLARIRLDDWRANRSARIYGDEWPAILTQPGTVIDNMDVCVSLARQNRFWCGRVTEPVARWRSSTAGIWVWGAGMRFNASGRTSLPGDSGSPVVAKTTECPDCTPRRTPIGIVNAGNEADTGPRSGDGRPVNADLYFAHVAWALGDPDGWPRLEIHTGPTPSPTPSPTASAEPSEPADLE